MTVATSRSSGWQHGEGTTLNIFEEPGKGCLCGKTVDEHVSRRHCWLTRLWRLSEVRCL